MTLRVLISLSALLLAPSAPTVQAKYPEGMWISDGYGLFVEFNIAGLQTYEITSMSCVPSRSAKRTEGGKAGLTVFTAGHDTIQVVTDAKPDILRMHTDGTASSIVLRRIANRPEICRKSPSNTPQENYAIFWQSYAEQYPFFALRKVDWNVVDKQFRPQIGANTKPDELFQIFRKMIEPLQDAHTGLEASNIGAEFDGWRNDPNHLDETAWKRAAQVIETRYVRGELRGFCRDHIQFGKLGSAIGYLRLTTFYDYSDVPGYAAELQCLNKSLDSILDSSIKLNGLVIDVRLNHGGDDPLGIEIAARLTDEKYLAYSKIARNNTDLNASLRFTDPQPAWVIPTERPGFKGKIVVLIGPDTVSAGETFAMALLDRKPRMKLIGANTQGVFSDVLGRSLPNGWRFHLPNEVYLTSEGKAFDGTGVPPDTRVPFFSEADLQNGKDAALEEAVKQLTNGRGRD